VGDFLAPLGPPKANPTLAWGEKLQQFFGKNIFVKIPPPLPFFIKVFQKTVVT
jgi:hypothetical protein